MKFTTAQKVRLWFALGCQALGIIVMGTVPTGDHSGFYYVHGDGIAQEFWGLALLIAAAILFGICVYRFHKPVTPAPPADRHEGHFHVEHHFRPTEAWGMMRPEDEKRVINLEDSE